MVLPLRPKVQLLAPALVEQIVDEALTVLEREGVFVENENARSLLRHAGAVVDPTADRVRIGRALVRASLASTPPSVTLYDRTGDEAFVVGGDNVHFDPGSTAVKILDYDTQAERAANTADLVRLVRVAESCDHLHFQSTALVSSDVPEVIADSYRLFIGLQYSAKPVVTGTFRVQGFRPMFEMLAAVRGGAEALRRKPLAIFDACPSPPLKWSLLTSQSLIDCARAGIPSELISMSLTGATSPVTLAGALVQHTAENLSGLVIGQLASPGAPIIFGGSPASFDMRKGTTPMGAIETMMIDMAYAQIGKHLGLPTHAYMGLSDAKLNDPQAGYESGIGAVLAALAGINVVSGAGMLDFESAQSPEKLVIDDEVCGMAYRLIEGIAQREDPIAVHLFEGFGPQTNFLTLPHTRTWYRAEHRLTRLADRDTYDAWVGQGRKTAEVRAHERVAQVLAGPPARLASDDLRRALASIMGEDARRNGLDRLPELPR
jgi:trimethylamine--corrinoid protein Co-methyltransferase